ncbi:MAG: radical SAM protein [Chloroflexota bacterium]|nr:radical SAM protein [Chloroflexota bacterium]
MPAYLESLEQGVLEERVHQAHQHLENCDVCPLECGVNRLAGELGLCKTGEFAQVSSYFAHLGEEGPISGSRGSGTIFFNHCNLNCVYCQNADISQVALGREVTPADLAKILLNLQTRGCHNINFVSPSHIVPQILAGVYLAAQSGLQLPLVYNTGGYDSLGMLSMLDGVVDIYMPDMKYGDEPTARKYSRVKNYPTINQQAVLEMQHQVGDLTLDDQGIAYRGLLVRHLVLPNNLAGSEAILRFLAEKISKQVYVNIMAQYHPAHLAGDYPELNRRIRPKEYKAVVAIARRLGLNRLAI